MANCEPIVLQRAGTSSAGRCSANILHQYPAALSDWCPRSKSVACFAQSRAKSISPISSKASAVSSSQAATFRSWAWLRMIGVDVAVENGQSPSVPLDHEPRVGVSRPPALLRGGPWSKASLNIAESRSIGRHPGGPSNWNLIIQSTRLLAGTCAAAATVG
jgi:hypothetical protein